MLTHSDRMMISKDEIIDNLNRWTGELARERRELAEKYWPLRAWAKTAFDLLFALEQVTKDAGLAERIRETLDKCPIDRIKISKWKVMTFSEFNEDSGGPGATILVNPAAVESCVAGSCRIAGGGVVNTLTFYMKGGSSHTVCGSLLDFYEFEKAQARASALDDLVDGLHERLTDRRVGDAKALDDKDLLAWLEREFEPFFPYTVVNDIGVWGTGELSNFAKNRYRRTHGNE